MSMELPEYMKGSDAAKRALMDAASMASSSNSVPRISLRGREFRFVVNGEEVEKVRDSIETIILGVEPGPGLMIKTFYEKGYQSGAKEPPTCASDDGVAPSPWVTKKQAQTCNQCPKNAFGSATSPQGKPTKACRDSKRVWLVKANEEKPIAERTIYGLNVTVASLKAFSDYGRTLMGINASPCLAVTKINMLDREFPELSFEVSRWVTKDEMDVTLRLSNDRPWKTYAAAGIALSMSDQPQVQALPSSLPGQPPAHIVEATQAPTNDVRAAPAAQNVDLSKW